MKEQARRMQRQLDTDYKNIHGEYIDCLVKWKVSMRQMKVCIQSSPALPLLDGRYGESRSGEVWKSS